MENCMDCKNYTCDFSGVKYLHAEPCKNYKSPKEFNTDHPHHYTVGDIECIDAIESALTPEEFDGFCKGNIIKYVWRENHKGGREDLEKAVWYLKRLIEKGRDDNG